MSPPVRFHSIEEICAWPSLTAAEATAALESAGRAVVATTLGPGCEAILAVTRFIADVTVKLLPAWLPDAAGIAPSGEGVRTARRAAARLAGTGPLFGPFVEDIAEAAITGTMKPVLANYASQTVLRQCHALMARSYAPRRIVLVVEIDAPVLGDGDELGLIWLASLDAFPVRLVGAATGTLGRIQTAPAVASAGMRRGADYATPLSGRPNPLNATELRLETHLSGEAWAAGRAWNCLIDAGACLPLRGELVWLHERCVVDIDGPEHGGAGRFAADRRRDRLLTQRGYTVLRFTDEEVGADVAAVAAEIAAALGRLRRHGGRG